ncbi:MAG: protein translocase subunit SecD [Acidimicrobiia bacterium]|nr:protein translocase subunit SecD [Acidimicrobiia bacterium]
MSKRRAFLIALITLAIAWGSLGAVLATGVQPVLGLDLQGGFSVVLTAPEGTAQEVLDKAVEIMRRRIEALGSVQEPEIALSGDRNIVVQLPGVQDRERALDAIGTIGQLSFRQVFQIGSAPGLSPAVEQALFQQQLDAAASATDDAASATTDTVPTDTVAAGETTTTVSTSTTIAPTTTIPTTTTTLPLVLPAGVDPNTGLTIDDDPEADFAYLLEPSTGIVYQVGPALVLGADITDATAGFLGGSGGGGAGQWVVDPDFTDEGATKFEEATKVLAGFAVGTPQRQFAIVLDGEVVSAPQVAQGVTPEEGLDAGAVNITIGFGQGDPQAEAEDLATVLRYGALPALFERSRVESVSATLGDDSLRAGLLAGAGGLALVALAMILYYRALGLITVVGLTVFGSLLLVTFSLLGETQGLTLTLAGVAGIIVSVGITSDSYIVYFERVKDEVRRGRTLRSAVDHAFARSFRTILTADAVSLAGAGLLWLLAIGPVRGFAIALGLATITDVIVAYFFTRPAAAWLVRTRLGDGGRLSVRGAVGHRVEAEAGATA